MIKSKKLKSAPHHSHVPKEVIIDKLNGESNGIEMLYARYNTSIVLDKEGSMFMWGEDTNNFRLRKVKLFHKFEKHVS